MASQNLFEFGTLQLYLLGPFGTPLIFQSWSCPYWNLSSLPTIKGKQIPRHASVKCMRTRDMKQTPIRCNRMPAFCQLSTYCLSNRQRDNSSFYLFGCWTGLLSNGRHKTAQVCRCSLRTFGPGKYIQYLTIRGPIYPTTDPSPQAGVSCLMAKGWAMLLPKSPVGSNGRDLCAVPTLKSGGCINNCSLHGKKTFLNIFPPFIKKKSLLAFNSTFWSG